MWECKFSTNCAILEKSCKALDNQSFYFDFDDKFRLLNYKNNFDVELWLHYAYLFELNLSSAEVVAISKTETNTQTFRISEKAQNVGLKP